MFSEEIMLVFIILDSNILAAFSRLCEILCRMHNTFTNISLKAFII